MGFLMRTLLKSLGIARDASVDDLIDASIEKALQDHRKVVEEVTTAVADRRHSNQRLRGALEQAKMRTKSFSEFEMSIRKDRTHAGH